MSLLVVVVVVVVWRRRALGVVDIFVLVWGVLGSPVRCCKYRASGYQDVEGGCKLLKWVIGVEVEDGCATRRASPVWECWLNVDASKTRHSILHMSATLYGTETVILRLSMLNREIHQPN